MTRFLEETEIIDYSDEEIQQLAQFLSTNCKTDIEIAKNCFEYVRDNINHSRDYKDNITTCKASDVLKYKTGWCLCKKSFVSCFVKSQQYSCWILLSKIKLF